MWRSLLFVPVLNDAFVDGAPKRGADAVVLDLEASIAADRKREARVALPAAVAKLSTAVDVTVRINPLWLEAVRDVEACALPGVSALHLARCGGPEEVTAVDQILTELEAERGLAPGGVKLIVMIESPRAALKAADIGAASERVIAMTLGVEDYATDMGVDANDALLKAAAFQIIQAAHAARIAPLVVPCSMATFRELDALEEAARHARALGSVGGYAVHPAQIDVLNRVFAPTADELAWARRVLDAADAAQRRGDGVFQLDGRMIDLPLVTRAKRIVDGARST